MINFKSILLINILITIFITKVSTQSVACELCLTGLTILKQSHRIVPTRMIKKILKAACMRKLRNKNMCNHISEQLTPIFLQTFWQRAFNPKVVCGDFNICKPFYSKLNLTHEINRIMANKPPNPQTSRSQNVYEILHLSDIHLDLDYTEGYSSVCQDIICCHKENGISSNITENARKYGNYKCDSAISLLQDTIVHIKQKHQNLKLIIVSGDMSAHNQWTKTMATNNMIVKTIIQKLSGLGVQIVFGFGNNQCYPDHQYNAGGQLELKQGIIQAMKLYLNPQQTNRLLQNGFYARTLSNLNLKIISLNTQVCDNQNFYLIGNVTDPSGQLRWLESQLRLSESKNQSVYMIGHIPPSLLGCSTIWSEIYRALVSRFNNTIKGQFYGHTHNDQFIVYTDSLTKQPVSILFETSSFTPLGNHQPSYRIYEIDSQSAQVINYKQFSVDLEIANNNNKLDWINTYNFLEEYNLKNLTVNQVMKFRDTLFTEEGAHLYAKYIKHLAGGMTSAQHQQQQINLSILCDTFDSHDIEYKCKNITKKTDKMNYFLQQLQGPWLIPL